VADKSPSSLDYTSLLHELTLKKWQTSLLEHDWPRAEIAARKLSESQDRFWSWLGIMNLATTKLYQGQTRSGLEHLTQTPATESMTEPLFIVMENLKAHILLETGQPEEAQRLTQKVLASEVSSPSISETLYFHGSSLLKTENKVEARTALDQLRREMESTGRTAVKTRFHQLSSELAQIEGRSEVGLEELTRAYDVLSSDSPRGSIQNLQGPILFYLAKAHRLSNTAGEAIRHLETLTKDSHCLLDWPIYFVRSHYLLGDLYRSQGDFTKAKAEMRRFLDFWRDGDIDRAAVEEARTFLETGSTS
jgi:tetratricopeptide (TPR) repeat protein